MKTGRWDTSLALRYLAEAIPIIGNNGLLLLTVKNFQTTPPFYLPPSCLLILRPPAPSSFYYLELESNFLKPTWNNTRWTTIEKVQFGLLLESNIMNLKLTPNYVFISTNKETSNYLQEISLSFDNFPWFWKSHNLGQ